MRFITGGVNFSRELALHPVHLTPDKEGNLPPSALVPFCSYQGESNHLGRDIVTEMDNMTVCDKFQPTILEGQLCYTLDVAKLGKRPTKSGKSYGLRLLLDPNPYQPNPADNKAGDQSFKVFIHTLAQYTTFGPGMYGMSDLKKMIGTKSFKQLPDNQKRCRVHNREECQALNYLDQVQKECKCIPWALQTDKDKVMLLILRFTFIQQDFTFCDLAKETCVANQTLKGDKCLVPCEGVYASIVDNSLKQNVIEGKQSMTFRYLLVNFRFQCFARRMWPRQ